ncbi:MAG: hypothetical protein WCZ72_13530 [Gemmobacter sp.]
MREPKRTVVSPAEAAKALLNARSGAFGDMVGGVKLSAQTIAELERIARG